METETTKKWKGKKEIEEEEKEGVKVEQNQQNSLYENAHSGET